ncbi:MAG: hypothetical protein KAR42_15285 [candidate division Zixibacteria bacterium]|nr:hypothetical protein [candidate division Zixibacteria bacterium]
MRRNLKDDLICLSILIVAMGAFFYAAHTYNRGIEARVVQLEGLVLMAGDE